MGEIEFTRRIGRGRCEPLILTHTIDTSRHRNGRQRIVGEVHRQRRSMAPVRGASDQSEATKGGHGKPQRLHPKMSRRLKVVDQ
jgi:hypothetical protein